MSGHSGIQGSSREAGFTLVEMLAALALASLIFVSLNLGMTSVQRGVDRTRESLGSQDALTSATGVFAADTARIARIRSGTGKASPAYLFTGSARQMIYPVAEVEGAAPGSLYLVRMSVTGDGDRRQLVRARTPFRPGETPGDGWKDAVVLLDGAFDIAFAYRAPRSGVRGWSDSWSGTEGMPEQVRLTVTDRDTGRLRLPVLVQSLHIDTEVDCAAAVPGCGFAPPEGVTK